MLLSVALLGLFMTGFWLYCLTDAVLTPATECRGMPKSAWIAIIALTFVGGAVAWLIVRAPVRSSSARFASSSWEKENADDGCFPGERWTDTDDAVARHPASRAWVTDPAAAKGPDDDPEFLRALHRAIHGSPDAGEA
ncbi:MAG: hypothetical protein WAK82_29530 [Streptosporangiaceae bacterium]